MAQRIHVKGIVQGVGFRPFVYRLAHEFNIDGWVLNAVDGVHVHAEGAAGDLDAFIRALSEQAPPASMVTSVTCDQAPDAGRAGFEIRVSDDAPQSRTLVSPDLASCEDCRDELFNPEDRRFEYPFINCTNCGPRFTITRRLPYDRAQTSMRDFALCEPCSHEYHDAADRRFHAQPNACFTCGPQLALKVPAQSLALRCSNREESSKVLQTTAQLIAEGAIVAIKGLGGYHLACDACNEEAVSRLRKRKQRPRKPLAVMFTSLEELKRFFMLDSEEAELLAGPAAPIVLLRNQLTSQRYSTQDAPLRLAPSVCCGLTETGVMLPATPVQHLLLALSDTPLVMTSANISEEPIIGDDDLAEELLKDVADAFLSNNREIVSRYDDSVLRVLEVGERSEEPLPTSKQIPRIQYVRRARGYAPRPLELPLAVPEGHTLLAVGPEQKNTFCLANQNEAFVSQHLGNLTNARAFSNQLQTKDLYQELFSLEPTVLVADKHPQYLSSNWAREQAQEGSLPLIEVQHHHAHIAAVLAEHLAAGTTQQHEVIGIALDGTGYGCDQTIWGGELLLASLADFERKAHLEPFCLPGGAQAITHPLRAAYALLLHHGLEQHPAADSVKSRLGSEKRELIEQMVNKGLNAPRTSSAGRLFDAISALLGVADEASYEGEPAILLEAALTQVDAEETFSVLASQTEERVPADPQLQESEEGADAASLACANSEAALQEALPEAPHDQLERPQVLKTRSLVQEVLDLLAEGAPLGDVVRRFHDRFMQLFVEAACLVREQEGRTTVALSGGVFNNRYVATQMPELLKKEGFTVLMHLNLPPNDGCISYGQAAVACARLNGSFTGAPSTKTFGGATL